VLVIIGVTNGTYHSQYNRKSIRIFSPKPLRPRYLISSEALVVYVTSIGMPIDSVKSFRQFDRFIH